MNQFNVGQPVWAFVYPLDGESGYIEFVAYDYLIVRGENGKPYFIEKEDWDQLHSGISGENWKNVTLRNFILLKPHIPPKNLSFFIEKIPKKTYRISVMTD
jgi:hypothetical protein